MNDAPHSEPALAADGESAPIQLPQAPGNIVEADGDDALLQASRILQQLRSRIADLDRREQSLSSQMSVLDLERRELRERERQFELSQQERQASFREQEAALEKQRAELEHLSRANTEQHEHLSRAQSEFETRQTEILQETAKLQADRDALSALELEFLEREQALSAEQVQWQQTRADEEAELRRELEELRARTHEELQTLQAEHEQCEIDLGKHSIPRSPLGAATRGIGARASSKSD